MRRTLREEMAQLASDLGSENPRPTQRIGRHLLRFRPELRLSQDGVAARDFVRDGFVDGVVTRLAYRLLVLSALDLLEPGRANCSE